MLSLPVHIIHGISSSLPQKPATCLSLCLIAGPLHVTRMAQASLKQWGVVSHTNFTHTSGPAHHWHLHSHLKPPAVPVHVSVSDATHYDTQQHSSCAGQTLHITARATCPSHGSTAGCSEHASASSPEARALHLQSLGVGHSSLATLVR